MLKSQREKKPCAIFTVLFSIYNNPLCFAPIFTREYVCHPPQMLCQMVVCGLWCVIRFRKSGTTAAVSSAKFRCFKWLAVEAAVKSNLPQGSHLTHFLKAGENLFYSEQAYVSCLQFSEDSMKFKHTVIQNPSNPLAYKESSAQFEISWPWACMRFWLYDYLKQKHHGFTVSRYCRYSSKMCYF